MDSCMHENLDSWNLCIVGSLFSSGGQRHGSRHFDGRNPAVWEQSPSHSPSESPLMGICVGHVCLLLLPRTGKSLFPPTPTYSSALCPRPVRFTPFKGFG